MASIKKILTKPRKDGTRGESWQVRWRDHEGRAHKRNRKTRAKAEELRAQKVLDPDNGNGATVRQAAEAFLGHFEALVEAGERRRSTLEQKRQHLHLHLFRHGLGAMDIAEVRAPDIQEFFDWLIETGRSYTLARKIAQTVRQAWKWAAVRRYKAEAGAALMASIAAPRSKRLGEGVEIPERHDCRAMLEAADARAPSDRGRAAAVFRVLMLSGLRSGELRALRWADLRIEANLPEVLVRRSADKWGEIHNAPKTDAGRRSVPLSPDTVAALRRWKLAAPTSELGLAFPNEAGRLWTHDQLYRNCWTITMRAAGLASPSGKGPLRKHPNGDYRPTIWKPDYSPHKARHVAASLWIAQGAGRGWIKKRMGHSTMKLVDDLYGHLWTDTEEDARIAAAVDRAFD